MHGTKGCQRLLAHPDCSAVGATAAELLGATRVTRVLWWQAYRHIVQAPFLRLPAGLQSSGSRESRMPSSGIQRGLESKMAL